MIREHKLRKMIAFPLEYDSIPHIIQHKMPQKGVANTHFSVECHTKMFVYFLMSKLGRL